MGNNDISELDEWRTCCQSNKGPGCPRSNNIKRCQRLNVCGYDDWWMSLTNWHIYSKGDSSNPHSIVWWTRNSNRGLSNETLRHLRQKHFEDKLPDAAMSPVMPGKPIGCLHYFRFKMSWDKRCIRPTYVLNEIKRNRTGTSVDVDVRFKYNKYHTHVFIYWSRSSVCILSWFAEGEMSKHMWPYMCYVRLMNYANKEKGN